MIDASALWLFAAASLVLALTPGPDMLLIASRSAVEGRASGFAALAGAMLGCFCQAMAAGLGLSRLFLAIPAAFDAVRLAGAAYLLYLAVKTILARPDFTASATHEPDSLWAVTRQGLLTNLLNPKVALFMLALLPQFMRPERGHLLAQVVVLSAIQLAIGFAVNSIVVVAAAKLAGWVAARAARDGLWRRVPGFFLGSVFAALALRLAWPGQR